MAGDEITLCEGCGYRIDPDSPDTRRAEPVEVTKDFDGTSAQAGVIGLFHARCWHDQAGWRLAKEGGI